MTAEFERAAETGAGPAPSEEGFWRFRDSGFRSFRFRDFGDFRGFGGFRGFRGPTRNPGGRNLWSPAGSVQRRLEGVPMVPILCSRVSAGISHNIAQERQANSLHGGRAVILSHRIRTERLASMHCMHRRRIGDQIRDLREPWSSAGVQRSAEQRP